MRKSDKSPIQSAASNSTVKGRERKGFDWPPLPECMAQEDLNRRREAIELAKRMNPGMALEFLEP